MQSHLLAPSLGNLSRRVFRPGYFSVSLVRSSGSSSHDNSRRIRSTSRRQFSCSSPTSQSAQNNNNQQQQQSWRTGPSPPRLPKEEQEIFEKLQKQSTGAFSTPLSSQEDVVNVDAEEGKTEGGEADRMLSLLRERARATISANGSGEELHPDIRRGAAPEFEGDVNPRTGEVGGPKNDPLRWKGDWSYNGRVTDF